MSTLFWHAGSSSAPAAAALSGDLAPCRADGGTRTHTDGHLKTVPLPIGLRRRTNHRLRHQRTPRPHRTFDSSGGPSLDADGWWTPRPARRRADRMGCRCGRRCGDDHPGVRVGRRPPRLHAPVAHPLWPPARRAGRSRSGLDRHATRSPRRRQRSASARCCSRHRSCSRRASPTVEPDAVGLSAASVNLLFSNPRVDELADELVDVDADVIVFSEYTIEHRATLPRTAARDALPPPDQSRRPVRRGDGRVVEVSAAGERAHRHDQLQRSTRRSRGRTGRSGCLRCIRPHRSSTTTGGPATSRIIGESADDGRRPDAGDRRLQRLVLAPGVPRPPATGSHRCPHGERPRVVDIVADRRVHPAVRPARPRAHRQRSRIDRHRRFPAPRERSHRVRRDGQAGGELSASSSSRNARPRARWRAWPPHPSPRTWPRHLPAGTKIASYPNPASPRSARRDRCRHTRPRRRARDRRATGRVRRS